MSQDFGEPSPFSDHNPYAGTNLGNESIPKPLESFPVYCTVFFILSLVFTTLRLLMVMLAIPGYFALKQDNNPLVTTALFEIGAGVGMVVFGFAASGLLLAKKQIGVPLAWVYVFFVACSIGVGMWQATILVEQFPANSPQRMGALIGAGFVGLLRLALLAGYAGAVVVCSKWIQRNLARR